MEKKPVTKSTTSGPGVKVASASTASKTTPTTLKPTASATTTQKQASTATKPQAVSGSMTKPAVAVATINKPAVKAVGTTTNPVKPAPVNQPKPASTVKMGVQAKPANGVKAPNNQDQLTAQKKLEAQKIEEERLKKEEEERKIAEEAEIKRLKEEEERKVAEEQERLLKEAKEHAERLKKEEEAAAEKAFLEAKAAADKLKREAEEKAKNGKIHIRTNTGGNTSTVDFIIKNGEVNYALVDDELALSFAYEKGYKFFLTAELNKKPDESISFFPQGAGKNSVFTGLVVGTFYWCVVLKDQEAENKRQKYVPAAGFGSESSSKRAEGCSCIYGNPCVDQYICLDWSNRFTVAKNNLNKK